MSLFHLKQIHHSILEDKYMMIDERVKILKEREKRGGEKR
jgi:hypothetical protein